MSVINLNKAKKTKAKADAKKQAEQNRIKFGRTKQEKQLEKAKAQLDAKKIDAHKRESD